MRALLLAGVVAVGWIGAAQASIYSFGYTFADTGAVVRGALSGNVEANGLTFDITGFVSLSVNGVAVTNNPSVLSTDTYTFGGNKAPTAAINASYLDFALTPGTGTSLFFGVGDQLAQTVGSNVAYDRGYGGSGTLTAFNPALYTSSVTAVPEPASLALLALPLGAAGLIVTRRRRDSGTETAGAEDVQLTGGSWDATLPA